MWFIFIGAVLLFIGAEALVRSSVSLAGRVGMSPLIAGLTVVAFGTSAPELGVSVSSALSGSSGIALGNVVGSNIFNIAVILGLAAMIKPVAIELPLIKRDIPVMVGCAGVACVFLMLGGISAAGGILLLLGLVVYLWFTIRDAKREGEDGGEEIGAQQVFAKPWGFDVVVLLVGLGMLVAGSQFFVTGAVQLAKTLGVSDAVVGLTIVAAGTSLPELATSVVAAVRGQSPIAIGNVVGSNIFNILCILGVTATVAPIDAAGFGMRDGWVMLGFSALLVPFAMTGRRISRFEGTILLLGYGAYLVLLWPR
ncbi:MAG: calcium/sodium antiporter [Verrucomicrobiaceae bacterium]